MKRLLLLLYAVCLLWGLVGCGGDSVSQQSAPAVTGAATKPTEPTPTVEMIPLPEEEVPEHPLITMPQPSIPHFPVPDESVPEIPLPTPVEPEQEIR